MEADAYWCLSKLLDSIQDHYTFAQPGIQRMVFKLKARYTPLACYTPLARATPLACATPLVCYTP